MEPVLPTRTRPRPPTYTFPGRGPGLIKSAGRLGGGTIPKNDLRLGPVAATERALTTDEFGVRAAARQQCGMVSVLDQMACIENRDRVGVADGRKPMGDDDGGAIAHQRGERLAHLGFADRVKVRGGLVEDEDRSILEEGARAMATRCRCPAREPHAAFADTGVKPRVAAERVRALSASRRP